jgi:HAD superfamily hydrolase (TIGR01509 family)
MPRRNYYQAVIFNLDGLLMDTERITCDAWKRAGGGLGYPMSEPVVQTLVRLSPKSADKFLKKIFGPDFPFVTVYQRMNVLRDAYIENWDVAVKRGVRSVLAALRTMRVPKAVASWNELHPTRQLLQKTELEAHFEVVVTNDDLAEEDDSQNLYEVAADRLGIQSDRCIVVDKSEVGARSAHAAGMTVIMITSGGSHSSEAASYAYYMEKTLAGAAQGLLPLLATDSSTALMRTVPQGMVTVN